MADGYPTPQAPAEAVLEVKKSRFIAYAAPAATRAAALACLERARHDHPQASHHCWAYVLGDPDAASSAAMSDDGEPSGTAGKPILSVIQHKRIGDVMVVVSRYFGGIKLGAGGLVRAYAGASEAVLSALTLVERMARVDVALALEFAQEDAVRHWAEVHDASIGAADYGSAGVRLILTLAERDLVALDQFCRARAIRLDPENCGASKP